MTIHNVRLPVDVERGARGGPSFNTTILELSSGFEKRNINWSYARGRWDIGYGIQSDSDLQDVKDFFYARFGRAYGFRFKDWTDYVLGVSGTGSLVLVATGGETDVQIIKTYASGGFQYNRPLTRIVDSTYEVYLNDSLQTETTHYTIDVDTGVISFVSTLNSSDEVDVYCEFDVPVRFDVDAMEVEALWADAQSVPSIPVVEIRETLQELT